MTDAVFLSTVAGEAGVGSIVTIDGDEGRHAATVKRIRVGERVIVADGSGRAVRGPVITVTRASISVEVIDVLTTPANDHRWVCVQALAKGDRSGLAVELATEIGADEIIAWQASRSVSRWDQGRDDKSDRAIEKWRATAREATKQSRRYRVPRVGLATTAEIGARCSEGLWLVLHEEATIDIADVAVPTSGVIGVITGPEGGISPAELEVFTRAGATPVRISDGVLRTSTAGGVALAQLRLMARRFA